MSQGLIVFSQYKCQLSKTHFSYLLLLSVGAIAANPTEYVKSGEIFMVRNQIICKFLISTLFLSLTVLAQKGMSENVNFRCSSLGPFRFNCKTNGLYIWQTIIYQKFKDLQTCNYNFLLLRPPPLRLSLLNASLHE